MAKSIGLGNWLGKNSGVAGKVGTGESRSSESKSRSEHSEKGSWDLVARAGLDDDEDDDDDEK
jgi:hypothetical protein